MKCPECLEEIVEGEYACPYCGANLDEEPDCDPDDEKGLTPVLSVSDESEACAIKELLEGNGIPVITRSNSVAVHEDDYGQDTWGEVLVSKVDFENSLAIIQKYMDTQRELLIQEEELEDEESLSD